MNDTIYRQAAIDAIFSEPLYKSGMKKRDADVVVPAIFEKIKALPSAQPTLYGYSIEHLVFISKLLAKENLPPERVADALNDIGRIIALVRKESEEAMRKAVEQCMI